MQLYCKMHTPSRRRSGSSVHLHCSCIQQQCKDVVPAASCTTNKSAGPDGCSCLLWDLGRANGLIQGDKTQVSELRELINLGVDVVDVCLQGTSFTLETGMGETSVPAYSIMTHTTSQPATAQSSITMQMRRHEFNTFNTHACLITHQRSTETSRT